MKGIEEYFEENLGLPAYRINVAKIGGLEFNQTLDKDRLNYLANAGRCVVRRIPCRYIHIR